MSRRRLRITLKRAVVPQVRGVEVLVNGRRKTRVSGAKLRVPVDLRGLPKGTFRVTLKITLLDGRTVTDTRRYRTCAPRRRG